MKVGLIAMSGTPIRDKHLLDLLSECGGLKSRLAAVSSLPSLALLTVASVIGDQADVSYWQCDSVKRWERLPQGLDLVAISSYSAQIEEAYELANRFKANGTPVVIGGTHTSVLPDEAIALGHTAAIGEAELIWKEIIGDAQAGCLKSRYGELGKLCDLRQSPVPAFWLLDPEKFKRIPIQTSRGCPHKCEFCAASVIVSPR